MTVERGVLSVVVLNCGLSAASGFIYGEVFDSAG